MFQKGYTPHNKGIKMSDEYCAKLRGRIPWNKGKKMPSLLGNTHARGTTAWNKGMKMSAEYCANLSKAHIGQKSWNKGKPSSLRGIPRTEEVKAKMSQNRKGKGIGREVWNKGKRLPRGENSPNWKGGSGTARHLAMQRPEYKVWRDAVFQRDNYTCQFCDQYSGYLHADHIKLWKDHEDLRYEVNNGRTLCVPCHYYITFKRKMPIGAIWCNYRMTRKRG